MGIITEEQPLQTVSLGGSAKPVAMNGIRLSLLVLVAVNARVAVAIHLLKEKMT